MSGDPTISDDFDRLAAFFGNGQTWSMPDDERWGGAFFAGSEVVARLRAEFERLTEQHEEDGRAFVRLMASNEEMAAAIREDPSVTARLHMEVERLTRERDAANVHFSDAAFARNMAVARAETAERERDELLAWAEEMGCEMQADDLDGYTPEECSPYHSGRCWPCEAKVRISGRNECPGENGQHAMSCSRARSPSPDSPDLAALEAALSSRWDAWDHVSRDQVRGLLEKYREVKRQRDDAQREVCEEWAGADKSPEDVARERGWGCYPDDDGAQPRELCETCGAYSGEMEHHCGAYLCPGDECMHNHHDGCPHCFFEDAATTGGEQP